MVEEHIDKVATARVFLTYHHALGLDLEVTGGKVFTGRAGGMSSVGAVLGSHDHADVAVGDGLDAIDGQHGAFAVTAVAGNRDTVGYLLGDIAIDVVVARLLDVHA